MKRKKNEILCSNLIRCGYIECVSDGSPSIQINSHNRSGMEMFEIKQPSTARNRKCLDGISLTLTSTRSNANSNIFTSRIIVNAKKYSSDGKIFIFFLGFIELLRVLSKSMNRITESWSKN